jgi:hypothetical protein
MYLDKERNSLQIIGATIFLKSFFTFKVGLGDQTINSFFSFNETNISLPFDPRVTSGE